MLTCKETTVCVEFLLLWLSRLSFHHLLTAIYSKSEYIILQLKEMSWRFLYLLSYKQLYLEYSLQPYILKMLRHFYHIHEKITTKRKQKNQAWEKILFYLLLNPKKMI